MVLFVFQTLLLMLAWCAFSGIFGPFHLGVGFISAVVITLLNRKHVSKNAFSLGTLIQRIIFGILYFFWLLSRIIVASVHVTKLILSPKLKINPQIIHHTTKLIGDDAKTVFANSITLTPGTITADIRDKEFVIHQIDASSAEDIKSGAMEEKIQSIFGKNKS